MRDRLLPARFRIPLFLRTAAEIHENRLDHKNSVHYIRVMKNITFSADERFIELARDEAKNRKTTLNQLFRDWLEDLAARDERRRKATEAYENLAAHITSIPKLTRDQMNER